MQRIFQTSLTPDQYVEQEHHRQVPAAVGGLTTPPDELELGFGLGHTP